MFWWLQHPGSIGQAEPADMETDGVDSDDDNDVLKSDQVRSQCCTSHVQVRAASATLGVVQ